MNNQNAIESSMGLNRTGIGLSPVLSGEMIEGSTMLETAPAAQVGELELARVRQGYGEKAEPLGTMPPPSSLKGMAQTAIDVIKGQQPTVLLDRLGDRLGFERTGVRLYGALIDKWSALGSWKGGPSRADLESIQQDELRHFQLLHEALTTLGADPTVMTPAADVSGVASMGLLQVITDPRTTLPQALQAILTAELVDNDGWRMLVDLAKQLGQEALATRMLGALRDEERHLQWVRTWLTEEARLAAQRDLQPTNQSQS